MRWTSSRLLSSREKILTSPTSAASSSASTSSTMGSAAPRSLRCRNGTATPVLNACLPSCRGSTTPETVPPACTSPQTSTRTSLIVIPGSAVARSASAKPSTDAASWSDSRCASSGTVALPARQNTPAEITPPPTGGSESAVSRRPHEACASRAATAVLPVPGSPRTRNVPGRPDRKLRTWANTHSRPTNAPARSSTYFHSDCDRSMTAHVRSTPVASPPASTSPVWT